MTTLPTPATAGMDELPAEHTALVIWLATPQGKRDPKTLATLARSLGVGEPTLRAWSRLPIVREEVHRLIIASMGERLADVLDKLEEEAMSGSLQHQKLYLEMLGLTKEQQIPPQTSLKVLLAVDLERIGGMQTDEDAKRQPPIIKGHPPPDYGFCLSAFRLHLRPDYAALHLRSCP